MIDPKKGGGTMARTRKPLSALGRSHKTKAEIEERRKQEEQYKAGRDQLVPPDWLDDVAAREFNRIIKMATEVNFLDNFDLGILAAYCVSYSNFIRANKALQEEGLTDLSPSGMPIPNPNVGIADKALQKMNQCSTKLGLSSIDRLKLTVNKKDDKSKNKFSRFMEG